MGDLSRDGLTNIMQLPEECLVLIFERLDCSYHRKSFGLTCRRWLHIESIGRRTLQFECSFNQHSISSSTKTSDSMYAFHVDKLLTRFQQLQSLFLTGCTGLPDSGLTQLQYHGWKLQKLYLDCCFCISDNGLALVAIGCPNLRVLSLYRCNITDVGLETLAKSCTTLKALNLSHCSLISDNGLKAISLNCRQLQAVRISFCQRINGMGFSDCSSVLAYLEADFCKLKPEGMVEIVSGGGLEYMDVSGLHQGFYGNGLMAIGAGYGRRLKVLNCRMCRSISDESVVAIAKGCPSLREWSLARCHEIRIPGWESIGLNCNNLMTLHVNGCRNLCDRGLVAMRDGCRQLSVLHMNRCQGVTPTAMELFKCLRGDVEIKYDEIMFIGPDWAFKQW